MSISYNVYESEPNMTEALLIERMESLGIRSAYDINVYPTHWHLTLDKLNDAELLDSCIVSQ